MTSAASLARILDGFAKRQPVRAGSLIVTVFGDAIAPRGGTLWLGSLLEIMALFGVEAGLVRTALSRLAQENWFERSRAGKHSYYRLSAAGAAKFADATHRIYHAGEPGWDGSLRLAVLTAAEAKARGAARERLLALGFGQSAPTVLVQPITTLSAALPCDLPDTVWLTARLDDPQQARMLGSAAWQLAALADAYQRFIAAFAPLAEAAATDWEPAQAFRLRILLIHEYRRIILRDPLLPRDMLPLDWPGLAARKLCRQLYKATLPRSEPWLSAHGGTLEGPLPPPDEGFRRRFGSARAGR